MAKSACLSQPSLSGARAVKASGESPRHWKAKKCRELRSSSWRRSSSWMGPLEAKGEGNNHFAPRYRYKASINNHKVQAWAPLPFWIRGETNHKISQQDPGDVSLQFSTFGLVPPVWEEQVHWLVGGKPMQKERNHLTD